MSTPGAKMLKAAREGIRLTTIPQHGFVRRCHYCKKPVILIWRLLSTEPPKANLIAIQAGSWDGSVLYRQGLHIPHANTCRGTIQASQRFHSKP